MRGALLASLLLLVLALAGCSGQPGPDDPPIEEDGNGPRTSQGGGGPGDNNTDPPHDTVLILEAQLDLVGQDSQEFDATIPDNVTVVEFSMSSADAKVLSGFRIEVSGCGVYDQGGGTSIGNVAFAGRLCKDATSGPTKVTVSNTGLVQTAIKITGQIPKGNATA
ncbi:MAG: hypothetical protein AABY18_10475 [Candidatus Thermoplasmatota archaeon]